MSKISNDNQRVGKKEKIHGSNFIYTVSISLFGCILLVLYILFRIPPKNIQWVILFLLLVTYCITIIFTIIFYKFAKPRGFETPKQIFRRQFKKGLVIGIIVFIVFVIQIYFDIL